MSFYRIDFQNRRAGVFVADPFGFLSPREWGEPISHRSCTEQEERLVVTGSIRWVPTDSKWSTVRLPRDHNDDLLAVARTRLLVLNEDPNIAELEHELVRCGLASMTASADRRRILKSRREIIITELDEQRRRRNAERENLLGRITELEGS